MLDYIVNLTLLTDELPVLQDIRGIIKRANMNLAIDKLDRHLNTLVRLCRFEEPRRAYRLLNNHIVSNRYDVDPTRNTELGCNLLDICTKRVSLDGYWCKQGSSNNRSYIVSFGLSYDSQGLSVVVTSN